MLEWISAESWASFVEMRRKMRAPLTPYAERLIERELVKLKCLGHDPQACLDQSIMLGWRDVFPVREKACAARSNGTGELERMKAERSAPMPADVAAKLAALAGKMRAQ